jgi:uncharacterized membrane protein YphA (DoxX/SURF4 family)
MVTQLSQLQLPIAVLYAGLAGTVLALLVATIQNRWSLRVFFILALRLAIGWHFLFEGLHKLHSHYIGATETNRPFTSEPYFREAEGPLGPYVRQQLGDPVELVKAKTYPASTPPALGGIQDANLLLAIGPKRVSDAEAIKAVPPAVVEDWNRFVAEFTSRYRLSDPEKAQLNELTTAALAQYGRWIVGVEARESTVKFVSGETPLTAPQRLDYIKKRQAEIDQLEQHRASELGEGASPEVARLKEAKATVNLARKALIADADAFLTELKKNAFTTVQTARLNSTAPKPSQVIGQNDALLKDWLPPAKAPDGANFETLPVSVRQTWTQFPLAFNGFYPVPESSASAVAAAVEAAKARFANWYYDRDEFTGQPKAGLGRLANSYRKAEQAKQSAATLAKASTGTVLTKLLTFAAAAKADQDAAAARKALLDAFDAKYADMRTLMTAALPPEIAEGPLNPPEQPSPIKQLDLITMWVITAIGAMLLAGLLTPLACLMGVGFLVMTYLTHPPFPWLPVPPNTEGNPIFVNKNVIEALALMVILVHPTGRWMGLDALLHRLIFRNAADPR